MTFDSCLLAVSVPLTVWLSGVEVIPPCELAINDSRASRSAWRNVLTVAMAASRD